MTTRSETADVLDEWLGDSRGPESVWHWALEAKSTADYEDALVRDIVDVLISLPYDLITCEDAEVMRYGLGNPPEEADLAQNLLWNHMDSIDAETRQRQLADHPFYGQFSGGDS